MKTKWGGDDAFTHCIIVGPTRCGKTATLIKPMIYQILLAKARGHKCGLSVIEPKGDVAQFVADVSKELGLPYYHLDPMNPTSHKINLMKGPKNDVSEATIAVLQGMFGKQEAFFQLVQELTARNFIKLLKTNHENNLDIMSVLRALRDEKILEREVRELEKNGRDPELLSFFQNEMKGRSGDKWRDIALGLRAQIENIVSNEDLRALITGDSGIDLDKHMAEGGILSINTALGKLRRSGDAFGQFMAMHLQSATFRRPGSEKTRVPHYLIIDEFSRYINPDTEKFLSIAAEYRTASVLAVQSFSQLEIDSGTMGGRAMKTAILTNCRNKFCFGGVTYDDAEYFANEIGKDWGVMRQNTYDGFIMADFFPKTYRDTEEEAYRIRPTDIQDGLPRFHFIHKTLKDGHPQKPSIAAGDFVPRNWKEQVQNINQKQAESKPLFSIFKKSLTKLLTRGGEAIEPTESAEKKLIIRKVGTIIRDASTQEIPKEEKPNEKIAEMSMEKDSKTNDRSIESPVWLPGNQNNLNARSKPQRKTVYANTNKNKNFF